GWVARQTSAMVLAVSLTVPNAVPQQDSQEKTSRQAPQPASARVLTHPPDLISDNLDRVAPSAPQILEVLDKETGLMVELKRLVAQEAGISGQILEESDLTDVSVVDRLRSDLHTRVIATRLLQRYGYLVPRVNPDSDLGTEQKFVQQERAQILARAAERHASLAETAPNHQNAACDPRRDSVECILPSSLPEERENIPAGPTSPPAPRSSGPLQRAEDVPQNDMTRPRGTIPPDQRAEYATNPGAPETVLTSLSDGNFTQFSAAPRVQGARTEGALSPRPLNQSDSQAFSSVQPEQTSGSLVASQPDRNSERFP